MWVYLMSWKLTELSTVMNSCWKGLSQEEIRVWKRPSFFAFSLVSVLFCIPILRLSNWYKTAAKYLFLLLLWLVYEIISIYWGYKQTLLLLFSLSFKTIECRFHGFMIIFGYQNEFSIIRTRQSHILFKSLALISTV